MGNEVNSKKIFSAFILVSAILFSKILYAEGRMYVGEKETHCELWSLDRVLGKPATCRRRAKRPSEDPITCRFKRSFINKDDEGLTMCVYERAGYGLDDLTISSETFVCEKEFKCKR